MSGTEAPSLRFRGEYNCWAHMRDRCTNPLADNWAAYGGRGISVCGRWLNSFASFLEDMGPRPTDEHSIDRIDGKSNYEPGNCRWATKAEQQANSVNARLITFQGETLPVAAWARRLGMKHQTLFQRLKRMSVEEAFTTPLRH